MKIALYIAVLNCLLAGTTLAADPGGGDLAQRAADNPYVWKSKVTDVAVFKTGLGFFVRRGDVRLRDGWCVAGEVPPAAFGTLAIYSHGEDQTVDIVGAGPGDIVEFDGADAADDADSRRGRLDAAVGLRVQLTYDHKGAERNATGTLVSAADPFAVLDGGEHSFALPVASVRRMQVLDMPLRVHIEAEGDAPDRATLGMAYLRKGITWIPEYTLRVIDADTAELTLRGTLVNQAEDLVRCNFHFVVGVPHFLHTDYMAPIAVGQAIRTIGAAVAPPQVQAQIMTRAGFAVDNSVRADQFGSGQPPLRPVRAGEELAVALGDLPIMESAGSDDYTVYTKQDLTVRSGEKAIVTLFTRTIRYSHLYRWSPPGAMQHALVLHNDTDTAWTTGPYLAVSGHSPLSEDLLRYVPRGGRGEVPVTAAINIAHEQSERELDRQFKAHEPSHDTFLDLVTVEGQLRLRNFEEHAVEVAIDVPVLGKPISASEGGTLSTDATKLELLKRAGAVRWALTIPPEETRTLTYRYERYVPSNP